MVGVDEMSGEESFVFDYAYYGGSRCFVPSDRYHYTWNVENHWQSDQIEERIWLRISFEFIFDV